MQESSTILRMLKEGTIIVPNYQRAYSWDTPDKGTSKKTQTDVFVQDLQEHINSGTETPYYFGHFIFERLGDESYAIVDGQQRLTTIVIFLSAVFTHLRQTRDLTEDEARKFRVIRDGSVYPFSTVEYDNEIFRDYVINHEPIDVLGLETKSAKRIVEAYDYFVEIIKNKTEDDLINLVDTILGAECTTHVVKGEAEAVQRFIFQNDRGKHPSKLEVLKAHFMYHILLYGGKDSNAILSDLQERFSVVYKNISRLEGYMDEDSLLQVALKVRFNTLYWVDTKEKIDKKLACKNNDSCDFIVDFSHRLEFAAKALTAFFHRDEKQCIEIHAIRVLGNYTILLPYIVKAYAYNLGMDQIAKLCKSYIGLALRDSIIGTRAVLESRLENNYKAFTQDNKDIEHILNNFEHIKKAPDSDWWWAYWNDNQLRLAIQGPLNHTIGKFILWQYENFLAAGGEDKVAKPGYLPIRYEQIENPELEHIAPQTPTSDHPENDGYDFYDDEFKNQYIDCLGNYLLLSKSHNCSASNNCFSIKRADYKYLEQQREIQRLTSSKEVWNKGQIAMRKNTLVNFVINHL